MTSENCRDRYVDLGHLLLIVASVDVPPSNSVFLLLGDSDNFSLIWLPGMRNEKLHHILR